MARVADTKSCVDFIGPALARRFDYSYVYNEFVPHGSSVRFDFMVPIHYADNYIGYEMKVSREDLMSDIRSGKWRGYLQYTTEFYFLVHEDVKFKDSEIPEEAGIMRFKILEKPGIEVKTTSLRILRRSPKRTIDDKCRIANLVGVCWRTHRRLDQLRFNFLRRHFQAVMGKVGGSGSQNAWNPPSIKDILRRFVKAR